MQRHSPARRAKDLAAASLNLHAPDLSAGAVVSLLENLVVELRLATAATFTPADSDDRRARSGADDPDGGIVTVPVHRPDGVLEGHLDCRGADSLATPDIETLAAHAGVALAGITRVAAIESREEASRRVAEQLQDALLPPVPQLPNTAIAFHYRAAARDARVGGDFYDVFPLPDGHALIVVGDVVGKGVEAAGRTSLITQTLRALALQQMPLDQLLERCDQQVAFQDPDIMATVWCGRYDPATGELEFASLGHPPALLLRAEADAVRLELEGLPLGMRDLAPTPPELRSRRLESRDLLVLYTDGVVEASGDYLAGQQALLAAIARRRDEPVDQLVDEAVAELLVDAGHLDDALMLLLRRR